MAFGIGSALKSLKSKTIGGKLHDKLRGKAKNALGFDKGRRIRDEAINNEAMRREGIFKDRERIQQVARRNVRRYGN